MNIKKTIRMLVVYAKTHLNLMTEDEIYIENNLINMFNLDSPYSGEIDIEKIVQMETIDDLLDEVRNYLQSQDWILQNQIEMFLTQILGSLTPLPSKVCEDFWNIYYKKGSKKALDTWFSLQVHNNYIQKKAVDRNKYWKASLNDDLYIEITINLSKPEKDNKETAKLLSKPVEKKYPNCLLCYENVGFGGTDSHPARQNLRVIPITLNKEDWFIQFSPYQYYYQHCIVIDKKHRPMTINTNTYKRFVDFLDIFPEYFIGSNAPLPIVGGSILNHEHYQGGAHMMPVMFAKKRFEIETKKYTDVKLSYLEWENSCIKIESKSRDSMVDVLTIIQKKWEEYTNEECEIIAKTGQILHNAVTPVMRKNKDIYEGYVILRNNRTNEKYPNGIFHAHPEYHGIKKESIGLIEAMGLFILPGRLDKEINQIVDFFNDSEQIKKVITDYINEACCNILRNTAVFKNDEQGNKFVKDFLRSLDV